jgi:hypothetical protein
MGRKKSDDEDVVHKLEKEIRELKSLNRSLQKRLKKLNKGYKAEEFDFEEKEKEDHRKDDSNKCPDCLKGHVVIIELGPRKQQGCNTCGWRGKITK